MIFEEITRIKSSTDDQLEETLIIEGKKSVEEGSMRRAKVKMEEVREENERLKLTLSRMMENYQSLKMHFTAGVTHRSRKATNLASVAASDDESDFVSLRLGRFPEMKKKKKNSSNLEGIKLQLNCNSPNLRNGEEEGKRSRDIGDDEILQQNPLKKTRVSVRAVCPTQTMHDGCQWRKYGQKISKGNPCPRAYYRCTVASSCPVRKQVQRCMDDMTILITTYEGSHNHPLPPPAATMASATSAAAAMLSCGSSSSPPRHGVSATSSYSPNLLGFNNFPRATISTSQSHPTVVLDLTRPNHSNKFSSTLFSTKHSAPTSLNFSSFDPKIGSQSKPPTVNNDKKIEAITHDPNFQSALAAAITSFVGNNNLLGRNLSGMDFGLNFSQPTTSSTASVGCGANFMNRFPLPVNYQPKHLTNFAPLTLYAESKSHNLSLSDEGEQTQL